MLKSDTLKRWGGEMKHRKYLGWHIHVPVLTPSSFISSNLQEALSKQKKTVIYLLKTDVSNYEAYVFIVGEFEPLIVLV